MSRNADLHAHHPLQHDAAEERASAFTHGAGAVAAVLAGVVLVGIAAGGTVWQLVSAIVFSISLVGLYAASTLYHAAVDPLAKARLKVLDHCAIYVLIAGSYTPFALVALHGVVGWWLFGIAWSLALAGVVFKLYFTGRFKRVSTLIYVAMGWMVVLAIRPVWQALDAWSLAWLFAGGAFYTLGTYYYHRESQRYAHAVWHLFCIVGSACHWIAILAQVRPAG